MSTPKIIRAAQTLFRQVSRMAYGLGKGLVSWLLRGLFIVGRQPLLSKAGFVLPTTVLLLLVVVLTVGAISYRTFTRTQQSISERQQQVIYNAATPVIDRAKSKIEFLFDPNKDSRGTTITPQPQLLSMMLNDGKRNATKLPADPYTFEGEDRIDVNGDGTLDNAWRYPVDLDGDGNPNSPGNTDGEAVYSIIFTAPEDGTELRDARTTGWQKRANKLEVRNAPLSNASQSDNICERNDATGAADVPLVNGAGWFPDQGGNSTKIRKNFQVTAYVVPDNPNASVATLEFQQDREATQGFKWAAWFRNDLEIFPGPAFSWNGAMHTEGNLIVGGETDKFHAFLVSSTNSCINDDGASEITVKANEKDKPIAGTPAFEGRFIAGSIRDNEYKGSGKFDLFNTDPVVSKSMPAADDSVDPKQLKPSDFALDPVVLQTQGLSIARNPDVKPNTFVDGNWEGKDLNQGGNGRLHIDKEESTPYVDDTFRADNRWGPKPIWGPKGCPIGRTSEDCDTTATAKIGEDIQGIIELTGSDPQPGEDSDSVGLDGYWERRARVEGLRLIVGQRLELGDPAGWGGPGGATGTGADGAPITGSNNNTLVALKNMAETSEPLRPWRQGCTGNSCNEERQRKSLWDNLAAVQATAVYHNAMDTTAEARDFPDACLISTVHPGTPTTLDRSATFENLAYGLQDTKAIPGYTDLPNPLVITDVFRGRGTNGWEFDTPTAADFKNTSSPLMKALANLANYAGDPNGGAPSFQVNQTAGQPVHPYPSMAMWGDFSMLRRVLGEVSKVGYDRLSPADKTTLHTAGCMMGMLAYNVDYLEKLNLAAFEDPTLKPLIGFRYNEIPNPPTVDITNPDYSAGLRGRIRVIDHLVQGAITPDQAKTIANQPPEAFVASLAKLTSKTPNNNPMMDLLAWDSKQSNNPETYVRLLERWRDALPTGNMQKDEMNRIISLAQLIISKEQVARDRTWGFREFFGSERSFFSTAPLGDCGTSVGGWLTQDDVPNAASGTKPDPLSRLCSARPRYPILYSLFPARLANPDILLPDAASGYAGGFIGHGDLTDTNVEEAVRDYEDRQQPRIASYIKSENGGVTYAVVNPAEVKLNPLTLSQGATLGGTRKGGGNGTWVLPTAVSPINSPTPNSNQYNLLKVCSERCSQPENANSNSFQLPTSTGSTLVRVAFKDGAFYNGREMLPVRTLDLDLDLMRKTSHNGDQWLPKRGIIYAFREDAVSESHIVRPPTTSDWSKCDTDAKLQSASCRMTTAGVSAFESKDPPVNDENGISAKPVDYYPDPDRRPHGFRLRQGTSLERTGDEGRGLSLISDNPVYVQGDFNLHQKGGTQLEEFAEPLKFKPDGSYDNFYDRAKLDLAFATREGDDWRPSEIVADAVSLLSSNFCDGSIQDGFDTLDASQVPDWLSNRYGCPNGKVTSFLNQNRPKQKITNPATQRGVFWERANMIDSFPKGVGDTLVSDHNVDEGESPIFLRRDGKPIHWKNIEGQNKAYTNTYIKTEEDRKSLIEASENRMNMIMVSGLVPSREGQSYGGLHNFPRFLENWGGKNLYISGAFLQLSFSTSATAPYDQEAWQPGSKAPTTGNSKGNEWIRYYSAPNRRWGYDVGLQYAPSGPVAQRFQFAEDTRSEFYTEPPADDPYIRNLCLQVRDAARCP